MQMIYFSAFNQHWAANRMEQRRENIRDGVCKECTWAFVSCVEWVSGVINRVRTVSAVSLQHWRSLKLNEAWRENEMMKSNQIWITTLRVENRTWAPSAQLLQLQPAQQLVTDNINDYMMIICWWSSGKKDGYGRIPLFLIYTRLKKKKSNA